jgi:cytochrome c oxidase subunit 2
MWRAQHPQGQREINDLHVPVGQPVRLTLASEDVIHSYYVPAFRTKSDVLPGRYTQMWFEATKPGRYHIFCAEYCGAKHSEMIGTLYALSPEDYERWLIGAPSGETPVEAGARLFEQQRCNTCHSRTSDARGPDLAGRFGLRTELEGGRTVLFDEDYVRESILEPKAKLVAGFQPLMPTYEGQLGEEQILQLIAYLKSQAGEESSR